MKIVTTYVAFDDEEFSTLEDCERYEQHYMDLVTEINSCVGFFDKDMNLLFSKYARTIEGVLDELCAAYDRCEYILITEMPSTDAVTFIWDYFGYEMPPRELGLWRYNFREGEWEKA